MEQVFAAAIVTRLWNRVNIMNLVGSFLRQKSVVFSAKRHLVVRLLCCSHFTRNTVVSQGSIHLTLFPDP